MQVVIIGAGPAGLIAAKLLKERFKKASVVVLDKGLPLQPEMEPVPYPRWVQADIGSRIGVHLTPVDVLEIVRNWNPTINANMWAMNTVGKLVKNHLWCMPRERISHWFESYDMMERLTDICCNSGVEFEQQATVTSCVPQNKVVDYRESGFTPIRSIKYDYLINTAPLPWFISITNRDNLLQGLVLKYAPMRLWYSDMRDSDLNEVSQIIYDPSAINGWVRFSNNKGWLTMEQAIGCDPRGPVPEVYARICTGAKCWRQVDLDKRFIINNPLRVKGVIKVLTDLYGIYQLGRFATWSYKLIHHIPDDVDFIIKMIEENENARQFRTNR